MADLLPRSAVCVRIMDLRMRCPVVERAEIARSLVHRLFGLMGKNDLPEDSALIIPGCRQVHTAFMRFPIDVVFVDHKGHVIATEEAIRPWRISRYFPQAFLAIELPAGCASSLDIRVGDELSFEEVPL